MADQELLHYSLLPTNWMVSPALPDLASNILLLLAAGPTLNEGLFTNFSLEPSWRWYFQMTPFESLFLGLIILQFAVLNLFGIMPLRLDLLVNGDPAGRKKRAAFEVSQAKKQIASQLLLLLKKLDPDECSFKTVCELQARKSCFDSEIPKGISSMLSSLNLLSKKRKKGMKSISKIESDEKDSSIDGFTLGLKPDNEEDVLKLYEEAAEMGNDPVSLSNVTSCEKRYHRCPVNGEEILGYVKEMHMLDDLFFDT